MLNFFFSFVWLIRSHHISISIIILIVVSRLSWWQQVHEVLIGDELTVLINDCYCDDSVVLIETILISLVHESTHDYKPLSVRNNVFFLILSALFSRLLFLTLMIFIAFCN